MELCETKTAAIAHRTSTIKVQPLIATMNKRYIRHPDTSASTGYTNTIEGPRGGLLNTGYGHCSHRDSGPTKRPPYWARLPARACYCTGRFRAHLRSNSLPQTRHPPSIVVTHITFRRTTNRYCYSRTYGGSGTDSCKIVNYCRTTTAAARPPGRPAEECVFVVVVGGTAKSEPANSHVYYIVVVIIIIIYHHCYYY